MVGPPWQQAGPGGEQARAPGPGRRCRSQGSSQSTPSNDCEAPTTLSLPLPAHWVSHRHGRGNRGGKRGRKGGKEEKRRESRYLLWFSKPIYFLYFFFVLIQNFCNTAKNNISIPYLRTVNHLLTCVELLRLVHYEFSTYFHHNYLTTPNLLALYTLINTTTIQNYQQINCLNNERNIPQILMF